MRTCVTGNIANATILNTFDPENTGRGISMIGDSGNAWYLRLPINCWKLRVPQNHPHLQDSGMGGTRTGRRKGRAGPAGGKDGRNGRLGRTSGTGKWKDGRDGWE